jgi:release factor glutamine methyltransferase
LTLEDARRQGIAQLERAGIAAADAELLLLHAVHGDRVLLHAHPERLLTDVERIHYGRYLHERLGGQPVQYITGRQEFWGLEIRVTPDVLIPRPETELLVERLTAILDAENAEQPRIADCGTGSGCIALAAASERPKAMAIATDVSAPALAVARGNAARLGLNVHFAEADLLTCFADASLDIVVSNPPYVGHAERDLLPREVRDFEPPVALFAGPDGMDVYRRLIPDARRVLRPGGWLLLEVGYNQAGNVRALLEEGHWTGIETTKDLAGIERVVSARR